MDKQTLLQAMQRYLILCDQDEARISAEMEQPSADLQRVRDARDGYAKVIRDISERPALPSNGAITQLADKSLASPYHNMKIENMLERYAELHREPISVTGAVKEFVRVGLWPDAQTARDSVHPTMRVLVKRGTWRKIGQGHTATYERVRKETYDAPQSS